MVQWKQEPPFPRKNRSETKKLHGGRRVKSQRCGLKEIITWVINYEIVYHFFFLLLVIGSPSFLVLLETSLPPLPVSSRCLCLLPLHLIIFHPDAMLLMNSIRSSFVTVWKTHSESGSILCSDTLRKQSLDALCAPGRPEKTLCHAPKKGRVWMGSSEVNTVVPVVFGDIKHTFHLRLRWVGFPARLRRTAKGYQMLKNTMQMLYNQILYESVRINIMQM